MGFVRVDAIITAILLLFTVLLVIPPASATGTVSIGYSGSGGAYIRDNIFFSGIDTIGSNLSIRISGPGLSPMGVPLYDLNGEPGSGDPVPVSPDGSWKLLWIGSSTKGLDKMKTARYYFAVYDTASPEVTATASIMMKKAEFYLTASPNPAVAADYVVLTGNAERVSTNVRIDVVDNAGRVYRTFFAPVSDDGYFNYGFHVDMEPETYTIVATSPSMNTTIRIPFVVAQSRAPVSSATLPVVTDTQTAVTATATPTSPSGTPPIPAPLSPFLAIAGLLVVGGLAALMQTSRK
jgi:hypothetical protein